MEAKTKKGSSIPWYRHIEYWSKVAGEYIIAYRNIPIYEKHHAEFKAFSNLMGYRLVFESNLIEGEGLSEGETRKVINNYFPNIPDNYYYFKNIIPTEKEPFPFLTINELSSLLKIYNKHNLAEKRIIPSVTFAKKSKGIKEVMQHYAAYYAALNIPLIYKINLLQEIINCDECLTEDKKYVDNEKARNKLLRSIDNIELFNEDHIRNLHHILAKGLIPKDAKVNAGEYRVDSRMVGNYEVIFPSPELLPECMNRFIKKANSLIRSALRAEINLFEVAAIISHGFVRIHPFPDFNGRISRIILMIVLMAFGVPFPVTLSPP